MEKRGKTFKMEEDGIGDFNLSGSDDQYFVNSVKDLHKYVLQARNMSTGKKPDLCQELHRFLFKWCPG